MGTTPEPTRFVADADVLAADLFIDGDARTALDMVRSNGWLTLVASDPLLDDAEAVIRRLGDERLAVDWRDTVERRCHLVEQPSGDHPGLASAYAGRAAQLLTYDARLTSVRAGVSIRRAMPLSIRTPDAFVRTVDAAALYEATFDAPYPGPDTDPRG